MTAREELAELIWRALDAHETGSTLSEDVDCCRIDLDDVDLRVVADAILAAGEWIPNKTCGHPDRYDLRGPDDECIACAIENGP